MAGWRDTKRQMRRDVHDTMLIPAIYVAPQSGAQAKAVNVRLHTRFNRDEWDGGEGLAAMLAQSPRLRFDRAEIDVPSQNAYVAFGADEIYRVDAADPPDDTFISVTVSRLSIADARALPFAQWEASKIPAVNPDYDKILSGVAQ